MPDTPSKPTQPNAVTQHTAMIDALLDRFPDPAVPSIEVLWAEARRSLDAGETRRAKHVESLIYLLHNSVVPAACGIRPTTHFAYGGIGVVLHQDTDLGEHVMIGQGVTIGGNPGRSRIDAEGRRRYTPKIGNHVYISAGARVVGGIEIGDGVVIGANAVVTQDIPPLSVVAGSPATVVRRINTGNCLRSKAHFIAAKAMTNEEFVAFIAELQARVIAALETAPRQAGKVAAKASSVAGQEAASGHRQQPDAKRATAASGAEDARWARSLYHQRLAELSGSAIATQGQALLASGTWAAPGYEPVALTPDIDWAHNPFANRTWSWYLHQFHFLLPLLAVALDTKDIRAVTLGLELVRAWASRFAEDRGHETAWHDHASALRARHLLLLRQYLLEQAQGQDADLRFVESLLRTHVDVLASEDFYSHSTNHGLDQSLTLLELSMELDADGAESALTRVALRRIHHEVGHAFATDGGHVENSTAYLNYGVKQALEAASTGRVYFGPSMRVGLDADLLDRAIRALAYTVRPDRTLPLIGDTAHFVVRDFPEASALPSYPQFRFAVTAGRSGKPFAAQSLVLPESGWAMARSGADRAATYPDSLHLVFKCGFRSTYHRHDDDLSFVLYAFREEWLIDGGLYKHAPTDPLRIYARSPQAHSLTEPMRGRATRDLQQAGPDWGIDSHADDGTVFRVAARTGMFRGFDCRRALELDRSRLRIALHDVVRCTDEAAARRTQELAAKGASTHLTRFLMPADKRIHIDRDARSVQIIGKRHVLSVQGPAASTKIVVVQGRTEPQPYALTSSHSGVMLPAQAVEFHHCAVELDARFELHLRPRAPGEFHEG